MTIFKTLQDATTYLHRKKKYIESCKGDKFILNTGETILIENNPLGK